MGSGFRITGISGEDVRVDMLVALPVFMLHNIKL